jgi:hypothetical protein
MQPGPAAGSSATTAAPSSAAPPAGAATAASGTFMTKLETGQMMASKIIGTTVVSANNEAVGDINDVVLDHDGRTVGIVVGVGGFLGIGEKDVAVPFNALEFNAAAATASTMSYTAPNSNANVTGSVGTTSGSGTASNRSTATTGNTGTGDPNASSAVASSEDGVPDRIVLRMTKAELQAAPAFRRGKAANGSSTTTAPKP